MSTIEQFNAWHKKFLREQCNATPNSQQDKALQHFNDCVKFLDSFALRKRQYGAAEERLKAWIDEYAVNMAEKLLPFLPKEKREYERAKTIVTLKKFLFSPTHSSGCPFLMVRGLM